MMIHILKRSIENFKMKIFFSLVDTKDVYPKDPKDSESQ